MCLVSFEFNLSTLHKASYAVAELVEHCATSRKVTGSILDCFIGIFH